MTSGNDPMSEEPCAGVTCLTWGSDEDGYWEVTAECDGGRYGDCGWRHTIIGPVITADGVRALDGAHFEWRRNRAADVGAVVD